MSTLIYNQISEELIQYFSSSEYKNDIRKAREEFYKKVGIFDEESPHFEMKIAQFMDWYLFTRPLRESKRPIDIALESDTFKTKGDVFFYYKNLLNSRHSLFEFIKLKDGDVYVRDLFSSYKMTAKKSPVTLGFTKGEFFETRVIPHKDHFVFASSFCFHPPQARKYILKNIKLIQKLDEKEQEKSREAFILKLFIMRYKYDQYKHLSLDEIYSNNSRLNLQLNNEDKNL